uniref:Uncharacterized protein n=1 Tax=Eutreptiella gymnastica TaxID=73025 RepID=A0A7S4CDG5_9EUGL
MCSPGKMPQSSETSGAVRISHCDHRAKQNDTQTMPRLADLLSKLATRPTSTTMFPRFQRVADGAVQKCPAKQRRTTNAEPHHTDTLSLNDDSVSSPRSPNLPILTEPPRRAL